MLARDLRFGLRRLRNAPLFTAAAVGTLAVAIAANVAVFSAVSAILLRPLPISHPDRIVIVSETAAGRGQTIKEVSYRNFLDWRAQSRSFDAMAAIGSASSDFRFERAGRLIRFKGALVSASFFDLLGTGPQLGRVLLPADDVRGAGRVLVLGDGLWRRQFGADSGVVGTPLAINGQAFTVVGVMPPAFAYPAGAEAWTPVVPELASVSARWKVDALESRFFGLLLVLGRLAPAVPHEQARAELDVIVRRLPDSEAEDVPPGESAVVMRPLLDDIFGATRHGLVLLFAMVSVVLLIACANVSGLVLARAATLGGAFAIKSALGATRAHLVREWLVEMALVAAAAGAIGVFLAWIGLGPLLALAPNSLPRRDTVHIDLPVLAFALGLCVIAMLLSAVVPAVRGSRRAAREALLRARSEGGPRPLLARGLLTAVQVAFATVLLTGAGLLVRSFEQLRQIDLGFEPQHVLTLDVEPQADTIAAYRLAYEAIVERVAALPDVEAVGGVYLRPFGEGPFGLDTGYLLEGQRIDRPDSWKDNATLNFQAVTPGYFAAMRIGLRRGRLFSARDAENAPGVAIVSESTARRLWPGKDPLGQRLSIASGRTEAGEFPMQTVVGVVADVRYRGLADRRFDIYMPAAQTLNRVKHLMVRTGGDPAAVARSVQTAAGDVTKIALVEYVDTMDRMVSDAIAPWRFSMVMLSALAALGLMLAATGLFALVAYSVDQRAPELAVRLAIGATPGAVLGMILWQGGRFAVAGLVAGVALSLAFANRISSLLFQVPARDLSTFMAAAVILVAVALLASYLAARRVIRVDPLDAMRAQ